MNFDRLFFAHKKEEVRTMIGNEDIAKTLKMMHDAARYEFNSNNNDRAIDILNDARNIELQLGFKNQAAESMLEISNAYFSLKNYDLALWFVKESLEIVKKTNKTSTLTKASNLLEIIKEESECTLVT